MTPSINWPGLTRINTQQWRCGFCDREVASDVGWVGTFQRGDYQGHWTVEWYVAVCPRCTLPTFIGDDGVQVPGARAGEKIEHLPADIDALYTEARRAMGVSAYTLAVLAGRKILMHVSAANGAKAGESFKAYVDGLQAHGLVTAGMKDWVDEIRELGNDANHEIALMQREDAETLLTFVAMLLRIVFEYPEKGRQSGTARAAKQSKT